VLLRTAPDDSHAVQPDQNVTRALT
jgi:hypothetical protein